MSTSSNRSNPVTLDGASLSGKRYILVTGYSQARRVRFTLDERVVGDALLAVRLCRHGEQRRIAKANALDTTGLAEGAHTLTATVTRSSGAVIADLAATFTVANEPAAATTTSTSTTSTSTTTTIGRVFNRHRYRGPPAVAARRDLDPTVDAFNLYDVDGSTQP